MQPSTLMQSLRARVQAFPACARLRVEIARDIQRAYGLIAETVAGAIVVLNWAGEQPLGAPDEVGLATHNIDVFVGSNPGLGADRETPAMLLADLARALKNHLLSATLPEDGMLGESIVSAGIDPVILPDGYPLAAFRIRLRLDDDGGDFIL